MVTLFLALLVIMLLALLIAACIRIEALHDEITTAYEEHDDCHRASLSTLSTLIDKIGATE